MTVLVRRFDLKVQIFALAIIVLAIGLLTLPDYSGRGRPRLPVGAGTPAISLGERHGLILASDGSLWSWGSDFLGWPVLGLGNRTNKSTTLRRIGHDTNWVSISAGTSHNLAVKSDGTLWIWGMILGDPPTFKSGLQTLLAKAAIALHFKVRPPDAPAVYREKPWQLRNN